MRSACPARCISIAIASASSPAASAPSMCGNGSPGDGSILPEHRAAARRGGLRQTRAPLSAAPAPARSRAPPRSPISPSSRIAARSTWIHDVERLHALLQTHGDAALRAAFERGLAEQAIGAEYIAHYLGHADAGPCRLTSHGPASDDSGPSAAARRPGPGRRRRPQGRSAAEHLDAAEHGGIALAASEAGHDRRRSPISTRSSSACTSPMRAACGATSCSAPSGSAGPIGDFLTLLVAEEIAHRQQTRLARLTRRAHFPFLKTIDDFNFTYQSSLRLHMLGSALAPDFVTEGRSLIFWRASRAAARRTSRSPSPTARFRTASMPSSRRPPRSSTTSRRRFAPASSRRRCRPTRIRPSSSSTKSAISPTAPTPPTCSSTSSTSATAATAR